MWHCWPCCRRCWTSHRGRYGGLAAMAPVGERRCHATRWRRCHLLVFHTVRCRGGINVPYWPPLSCNAHTIALSQLLNPRYHHNLTASNSRFAARGVVLERSWGVRGTRTVMVWVSANRLSSWTMCALCAFIAKNTGGCVPCRAKM